MLNVKLLPSIAVGLLVIAAPLCAEAQSPEEAPPATALLKIAADLRIASESLQQSVQNAERLSNPLLDALQQISGNLADIGRGFDPLGTKEMARTIQAQQLVIQQQHQEMLRAQKREIRRLRAELRASRDTRGQREPSPRRQRFRYVPVPLAARVELLGMCPRCGERARLDVAIRSTR
jgi:hypothetical protein